MMQYVFVFLFAALTFAADLDDWWEHEVFYQIYPRSFADSNGDGVGDLIGIKERLGHLQDAGINAVWLSPIFRSPMVDFGYDISDFRNIHEEFGTIEDFEELAAEMNRLGIKLILDFVPNHTSDKHAWFGLSANKTAGYEDFYVWNDGNVDSDGKRSPPNNWLSNFGNAAWTFHEGRQQWYLHQFAPQQPDLNYRNPAVVQEMKNTIVYWLDKGVNGFRVDAVPFLYEDRELRDEPRSNDPNALPTDYAYLRHIYTNNQNETYDLIYELRSLLDNYSRNTDNKTRVMMTEAYADVKPQMKYYGDGRNRNGAHFTFNFMMITDLTAQSDAHDWVMTIYKFLAYLPAKYTPNWVLGNHDNHRVGTRFGAGRIDGLNMLLMVLPGVGVTYYGDEIGMVDGYVSWEQTKDPQGLNVGPDRYQLFSRDPERTPFQWDDSTNAGFSNGSSTWLPVASNYKELNLAAQKQAGESHYKLYQQLIQLRKHETFRHGELRCMAVTDTILVVVRELKGNTTYVLVMNIGSEDDVADLDYFNTLPEKMYVTLASVGAEYKKGQELETSGFPIGGNAAYILESKS